MSSAFDSDPARSFGYQVRATHRTFDRALQARIGPEGVPNGYWYVLRVLWRGEGLSQRELAGEINLTESSVVVTLDNMEAAGLIRRQRDTEDRRRLRVYLTDEGKRLESRLLHHAAALNAIAAEGIPAAELEIFLRVIQRMRDNLRR